MFLAPLPSPLARRLVTRFGYQLQPLPFGEAYALDCLNPPGAEGVHVDRSMLSPGVIPAFTYGSNPATPAKEYLTICAPLVLIAEDHADAQAVTLLLETIYESSLTTALHPTPPSKQATAFPRHAGVDRYLHRNDPLLNNDSLARLGMLAGALGAFVSGAIALYGLLRLRKLSRFESYYHEIGQIEMLARGLVDDPQTRADAESMRDNLTKRLSALKCRVLQEFAEGGLKGEGHMAGIIALINDTRGSLWANGRPPETTRPRQVLDEVGQA
jgi:hypothetical protein